MTEMSREKKPVWSYSTEILSETNMRAKCKICGLEIVNIVARIEKDIEKDCIGATESENDNAGPSAQNTLFMRESDCIDLRNNQT